VDFKSQNYNNFPHKH